MGYIVIGIVVFLLDIMSKLVVELHLKPIGSLPIWDRVFHLTYVENQGIAFGMFSGQRLTFIVITIAILGLLAYVFAKTKVRSEWMRWGMALVYGGAVGNLMERLAKGYVVDFLDIRLIQFPVFNIADIAVCVGAVCLMIHFFTEKEEDAVKEKKDA